MLCTGGLPTRGEPMSYVLRRAFRVLRPVEAGRGSSPPDLSAHAFRALDQDAREDRSHIFRRATCTARFCQSKGIMTFYYCA